MNNPAKRKISNSSRVSRFIASIYGSYPSCSGDLLSLRLLWQLVRRCIHFPIRAALLPLGNNLSLVYLGYFNFCRTSVHLCNDWGATCLRYIYIALLCLRSKTTLREVLDIL